MKLSLKQREALQKLAEKPGSAYGLKVSLATLNALCNRQMVNPIGLGHMAFPSNGTWKITAAGRAALNS